MLTRREANDLDRWLTTEPSATESDLYCPRCDVPSAECADELEHCTHWMTWRDKKRTELADYLYDRD